MAGASEALGPAVVDCVGDCSSLLCVSSLPVVVSSWEGCVLLGACSLLSSSSLSRSRATGCSPLAGERGCRREERQ